MESPIDLFDPAPPRPAQIPVAPARTRRGWLGYLISFTCGALAVGLAWVCHAKVTGKLPHQVSFAKPGITGFRLTNALPAADLAFGDGQVRRMVADRPEMLRYVMPGDPVWQYCANAFGGGAINERVYWDNNDPMEGYDCDHMGPENGRTGYIRIRRTPANGPGKKDPLSCEYLWSAAVFELENIRGTQDFDRIYEKALRGQLNRNQWIRENTRLEYGALLRTAKLSESLWLPVAKARGIPTTPSYWNWDVPATYEAWISDYKDRSSYPWDSWGRYYDDDIVPYLRSIDALKANRGETGSNRTARKKNSPAQAASNR